MFDPADFDPALVAAWPLPEALPQLVRLAGEEGVAIETKAAKAPMPIEALQRLLSEMTEEMRRQFELFRRLRAEAEARLASEDEAEVKLAKADIKAATDALSLIVRTLEKIDGLQRSIAHDRQTALEQEFDASAYQAMLADIERKIEARARERFDAWCVELGAAADGATGPPDGCGEGEAEPKGAAPGGSGGGEGGGSGGWLQHRDAGEGD